MAANRHPIQNGSAPGPYKAVNSNGTGGGNGRARVLTVDEALPFSPFSNVVPFNSDIIPTPSLGLRSIPIFKTPAERENGRRDLDSLNREVQQNSHNTSQMLQKSLHDLKELLKPENISQFHFKHASKRTSKPGSEQEIPLALSPFAKMVYEQTNINFAYLSPLGNGQGASGAPPRQREQKQREHAKPTPKLNHNSASSLQAQERKRATPISFPDSKPVIGITAPSQNFSQPTKSSFSIEIPSLPQSFPRDQYTLSQEPPESHSQKPSIPRSGSSTQREQHHANARRSEIHLDQANPHEQQHHSAPRQETQVLKQEHSRSLQESVQFQQPSLPKPAPIHSSSNANIAVVIPDLPTSFKPEDYVILPESPETPLHISRKRARSEIDDDEDEFSRGVDQREKADLALRNLRIYMQELFEAEDQFDPDSFRQNPLFISTSEGVSLTIDAHTRVESLLQKVIFLGRFSAPPLDDLLRLQKLSEGAMKEAEILDVKVDDTYGESELALLLQKVGPAELGVRAARTSLRLMSGGREEKQVYSEDVIQSALNTFKNLIENCMIPIVEMRSSGSSSATFKLLSAEKKLFNSLLTQCRKLFAVMADLVGSIELSETVINTLEFTATRLIFVENAHVERDSILGISRFDNLRVVAMDVLAQIFLVHPTQRASIFTDILSSLEKLPVQKQSARQFKLAEGGSIQLVSALIMRLVQTSASKLDEAKEKRRGKALNALDGDGEGEPTEEEQAPAIRPATITSESRSEQQPVTAIQELRDVVSPLMDTAMQNASYVVNYIVNRAMNTTKSGDTPYRNLLELFVEDFITSLNSTDWPGAELLLRLFLIRMVHLAENEKTPAPDKNMALDLLGTMGAAISELSSHVRKTAASIDSSDSELGHYLSRLAEASLEKRASVTEIVSWPCGPFRTSLEYLEQRSSSEPHLATTIGFFEATWAAKIYIGFDQTSNEDDEGQQNDKEFGRLAFRLRKMVTDRRWLSTEYTFDVVNPVHARLAYSLTLLNSQFCESFSRVLMILLGSMQSEQATVRSKSLKSVNQLLDTDPTIIDREPTVMLLITRCANDQSVQVRDSALQLLGKCFTFRPALEQEMLVNVLQRVNDAGVGVRKRAMKLSKDIYLRKQQKREVQSMIADALLFRVSDLDEGVRELARQTMEDIWMSGFYENEQSTYDVASPQYKLKMADQVAVMVQAVQRGNGVASVMDKVLQSVLSTDAKNSGKNRLVCKSLVATMFETIIDNPAGDANDAPSARDALQILTIFAKSDPQLFTAEQVQLLLPYISNVTGSDDLTIYRSVVIIFRHVLPRLSKAQNSFLASVRKELHGPGLRMAKLILEDVIACLWIISTVLNEFSPLTKVVLSSLAQIEKSKSVALPLPEMDVRKLSKFLLIVGMCGKHCDFEPQIQQFRNSFTKWKGKSVPELMCDTFVPFTSKNQTMEVRTAAFDAIGMVCQSWPKNFESKHISAAFESVFVEKNQVLETIVMKAIRDFLLLEEKRSEAGHDGLPGTAADPTGTLSVMGGGQGDGIAPAIARRFLSVVTAISLSRQDDHALLATEILASISRQGLLHPKEVGLTLVALETSQNSKIAEIAFREHRTLHEKHESVLDREHMRAVLLAYTYQRDVVDDTRGATLNPYTSKLHMMMEVMKVSKQKNRKRFFDNLCARIEFDPIKLEIEELPHHLDFAQFIIENMAFFEYTTIDELLAAIGAMERVVAATGTGIAHAIDTELFHKNELDRPTEVDANGEMQIVNPPVDHLRLMQLTGASMMLSNLWEARSFLRRQYGLAANKQHSKGKGASKDLTKAPTKVPFVTGDKFWESVGVTMSALESEESMMKQCKVFVDLLMYDQDFKVVAEGDEEAETVRPSTPSDGEDNATAETPGGSGRGRKRKASASTPGNRGRLKRARSSSIPRGRVRPKGLSKKASEDRSDDELGDAF